MHLNKAGGDFMAKHIQQIDIEAYRGIHDLTLKNLNSINILTGNNNSGKTSVLELISSLRDPYSILEWTGMILNRVSSVRKKLFYQEFYNLFPVDAKQKVIGYKFLDNNEVIRKVELKAEIDEIQIPEQEMLRINRLTRTEVLKETDDIIDAKYMKLTTYVNEEKTNEDALYDFQNNIPYVVEEKDIFLRTVYVSPVDHIRENLYLNYILSDSEMYEEMLSMLRTFDENIIGISAIPTDINGSAPEYMILTKDHKKALPLNVFGDGMKKAILLLSAVVKAKDGILLLDEFETAIHTSAMDSVFSWILESAKRLNVQVFLTSHSKEAIEKVLKCNKELQADIQVYTLYKKAGRHLVRTMTCEEAINAQDCLGLELRL